MKRFYRRTVALALAALMALSPAALASEALGDELHIGTVQVAPGVTYTRQALWSNYYSDLRTERYFTYTPGSGVYPTALYGDYVVSRVSLPNMAKTLEARGHRVVGGVNGDFYMVTTGVPLGILVTDGVLRSTSGGYYAIGFREDGSAFIGWPAVSVTATFSGYTLAVHDVNKERTDAVESDPGSGGYYLYTEDFARTTMTSGSGVDVILSPLTTGLGTTVQVDLNVEQTDEAEQAADPAAEVSPAPSSGDPAPDLTDSQDLPREQAPSGQAPEVPASINSTLVRTDRLTIGGRVSCVVEEVRHSEGAIEIPQGKMVLSISDTSHPWLVEMAAGLQPGDTVDIDATSADTRWNDAVTAMGGFYKIVSNGQVGPHTANTPGPRTAIGMKADGTVVFYSIDGRQPGYSIGGTLTQVAERLIELGCVEALGMDGGGSATVVGTMPWNRSTELLNLPSDGAARAVTNALFLITDLKPTGLADHFVVTPYDNFVLAGSRLQLEALAVDENCFTTVYPDAVTWSVDDGDGLVDADGLFTAAGGDGITYVTATSQNGHITGQSPITVVRTPDSIQVRRQDTGAGVSSLSLDPGQSVDLTASAIRRKLELVSQDDCYVWTADPVIGTVDENGLFTAADKSGSGELTVSAGSATIRIPVTVAGHIKALDTFEDDAGTAAFTSTDTIRISRETVADLVRCGLGSLRLDYDAASGSAHTAVNLAIPAGERYLSLWVYGDGSQNALTGTFADAAGKTSQVLLAALDFMGWQRCTVPLPEGAQALRTVSVIYAGAGRTVGSLWLDQLTVSNEDFTDEVPPAVSLSVKGSKLTGRVSDNVDRSFDASSIGLTFDGEPLSFQWDPKAGTLTAALPEADDDLHRVTVTAADQSGNLGRASENILPLEPEEGEEPAPAAPGPFIDMDTHWARPYAIYLHDSGVVKGVETNAGCQFQPEKNITRGEFFLMMARWMGLDLASYTQVELPFADADSIPVWALDGVKAIYAQGILKGSLDNGVLLCRSNDTISRAEAMTILGRIQPKGLARSPLTYTDSEQVPAWSLPYVESLTAQGIISGYDNLLRPNDPIKRGEVAKVLYYML